MRLVISARPLDAASVRAESSNALPSLALPDSCRQDDFIIIASTFKVEIALFGFVTLSAFIALSAFFNVNPMRFLVRRYSP